MFGNKKKDVPSNSKTGLMPQSTSGHSLNSLVRGTHVEGTIQSESDIRIDGSIKGVLNCKAKVIIGPSGSIEGEVICQNAVIEGSFDGNLTVKEVLHLKENAKVSGDVQTGKLSIQPGALFNVSSCRMGDASKSNGKLQNNKANRGGSTSAKPSSAGAKLHKETAS